LMRFDAIQIKTLRGGVFSRKKNLASQVIIFSQKKRALRLLFDLGRNDSSSI